jgi:hypothetical protein
LRRGTDVSELMSANISKEETSGMTYIFDSG